MQRPVEPELLVVIGEGLGAYKRAFKKPWLLRKSMRLDQPDPKETEGTRLPTFFMEGSSTKKLVGSNNLEKLEKNSEEESEGCSFNNSGNANSELVFQPGRSFREIQHAKRTRLYSRKRLRFTGGVGGDYSTL